MGASFTTLGNETQTTDATPTIVAGYDVPANTTAVIDITVVARALDGTSKVFFHKSSLSKGIILQLVNNLQNTIGDVSTTLWAFNVSVNEQNQIQFTVTGAAGTVIDWRNDGTINFFQPEGI